MKNRKIYTMIVIVLLMFEFLSLFLMYKSSNNEKNLNDLVIKELVVNDSEIPTDFIAMLFEKEDGSGYYESNSREWPNYMIFNSSKSGCLDKNGNRVLDALTYNDGIAKVITDGTIYCYLYFDIDRIPPVIKSATIIDSKYALDINTNVSISWDDKDVASYCVSNTLEYDNCEWSEVSGFYVNTEHSLSAGDGDKIIYVYLKDRAGNISEVKTDTITLDTESPSIPSLSSSYKDGSGNYTSGKPTNKAVHTTITSKDLGSGIDYVERTKDKKSFVKVDFNISSLKQSGTSWSGKFEWSTAKERDDKYYFRACDKAGRCSELSELFNIVYDFTPPTSNGVTINNGDLYTKNTDRIVTLELKSTDATEMCISNTTSCPANGWKNYEKSKSHTLTAGDGNKTVYVWYKDAAGNEIDDPVSDTITLDTTAPTGSISINSGATYATSRNVTLTLSASGATKMCISNTTTCPLDDDEWYSYATSKSWTLTTGDGSKTVYVWYKDEAGNVSSRYSDLITLDTVKPTCSLKVTTSDISFNSKSSDTFEYGMGTSKSYNSKTSLSLAKGTFYGYVKDEAGNEGKCGITLTQKSISEYNKTTTTCVQYVSSVDCKGLVSNVGYYCPSGSYRCDGNGITNGKCECYSASSSARYCPSGTNYNSYTRQCDSWSTTNNVIAGSFGYEITSSTCTSKYVTSPGAYTSSYYSSCRAVQDTSFDVYYNCVCTKKERITTNYLCSSGVSLKDGNCYNYSNGLCNSGDYRGPMYGGDPNYCYDEYRSSCSGNFNVHIRDNHSYNSVESTTSSTDCDLGSAYGSCEKATSGRSYVSACTPTKYSCSSGTAVPSDNTKDGYCYIID